MAEKVIISILMPVKNAEPFLEECLQSILSQTFSFFEVVAVDDGSTDGSFRVLERFAAKDHRIRVFPNKGQGIIDALGLAFSKSLGEYIHRMDADDIMPAHKLSTLLGLLLESSEGCWRRVATGKVRYFAQTSVSDGYLSYESWLNSLKTAEDYNRNVYRECVVASPNWLVSRRCFEVDVHLHSLKYPEDYDLVLRWLQLGYKVISSEKVTHCWREHGARTSRNSDHYQQKAFFQLKTNHFIRNRLIPNQNVQLIGAGVKGKLVAKILKEQNITFEWFDIKDKSGRCRDARELRGELPAILTSWPKDESQQENIVSFLAERRLVLGANLWLF